MMLRQINSFEQPDTFQHCRSGLCFFASC